MKCCYIQYPQSLFVSYIIKTINYFSGTTLHLLQHFNIISKISTQGLFAVLQMRSDKSFIELYYCLFIFTCKCSSNHTQDSICCLGRSRALTLRSLCNQYTQIFSSKMDSTSWLIAGMIWFIMTDHHERWSRKRKSNWLIKYIMVKLIRWEFRWIIIRLEYVNQKIYKSYLDRKLRLLYN